MTVVHRQIQIKENQVRARYFAGIDGLDGLHHLRPIPMNEQAVMQSMARQGSLNQHHLATVVLIQHYCQLATHPCTAFT